MRICFSLGAGLVLTVLVSAAAAGDSADPQPAEVLKKATEAAKRVESVRYTFRRHGIGADAERNPKISGTVTLGGWRHNTLDKYRVEVTVQRPDSEPTNVLAGSDGEVVYLMDRAAKKVFADMDPAVLGSQAGVVRAVLISAFVEPDPYEDQLKAEKLEITGTVKIGDEECYAIGVPSPGRRVTWFLSKKDYLPRGTEMAFPNREGKEGGRRMEITELVVNPQHEGDPFKLVVPEGFTKIDDFAP